MSQEAFTGNENDWHEVFVNEQVYNSQRGSLIKVTGLTRGLECTLRLQTDSDHPGMFAIDLPVQIWSVAEDGTSVVLGLILAKPAMGGKMTVLELDPTTSLVIRPESSCETAKADAKKEWGYFIDSNSEGDDDKEGLEDLDAEFAALVATYGLALVNS